MTQTAILSTGAGTADKPGAGLARISDAPGPIPTYYEITDGAHAVQLTAAELDEIALAYLAWRLRGRRSL